ncbi:DUF6305 family protein [Halanaerobium praevalens]|uniref:Succinylglutamate desuccinylase/aspartoacylase n=1 Tax=Halanaerobium praevalens (strain ATCC 33744 / DSM 2228 / GSL) TaxID=572479 RepID=E3DP69_HALPG|nr:DUF6305 family protein [Halanaerobium praevalens]ADO76620.1 Succinylglutamate desuccinylase/aspartoacylase [Halanaerobium praevalens DSM 2228]
MKSSFWIVIVICLLILLSFNLFSSAKNIEYYPAQPVAVTSLGQNPDGLLIKVVLENQNIHFTYHSLLKAESIENYPTLIIAVGHSCKGISAAGIDFEAELKRCRALIKKAKQENKFIILTHLGGKNRRDQKSDQLLELVAPAADYLIIAKKSNFDNYFSKKAQKNDIPLAIAENLSQIKPIIAKLFQGESKNVAYYINGQAKAKTILINAGIHGDEIASQLAALKLKKAEVKGGRLVVIPRANPQACNKNQRNYPQSEKLNRSFPPSKKITNTQIRAAAIFDLIKKIAPQLLLDLHESENFNRLNKNYVGQSIIAYPTAQSVWQGAQVVELINQDIEKQIEKFSLISPPKTGSLTQATGKHLKIPAFTLETCQKLTLAKRINYQLNLIELFLKANGVELVWP